MHADGADLCLREVLERLHYRSPLRGELPQVVAAVYPLETTAAPAMGHIAGGVYTHRDKVIVHLDSLASAVTRRG